METTVALALREAEDQLRIARIDSPKLSAQVLLAHVLGVRRLELLVHPGHAVSPRQTQTFHALVARRVQGEPVAYLVGTKEFFGLDFQVGPSVLIPRPETEELVEYIQGLFPPSSSFTYADLGTGSGVVAVTLALHFPHAVGYGVDIDSGALSVARANMLAHGAGRRLLLIRSDFLAPFLPQSLDLVVTNPPYISDPEFKGISPEVAGYEPKRALVAGPEGLECLRRIEQGARLVLKPGGTLVAEMGWSQGPAARTLFRRWEYCGIVKDLSRKDRFIHARL
ncbi:peptide chain release factor N(5)-glutamine methyltransferase [Desulfoplanes sp.]